MMSSLNLYEMGMKKAASGPRSLRNPASGFAVESKGERDPDLGKGSSRKTRLVARLRYYLAIRPMLQGTNFGKQRGVTPQVGKWPIQDIPLPKTGGVRGGCEQIGR